MNEARPFASLSSGLLARKGAAKPAMRPQGYAGFEDLGWNDMGYDPAEAQQSQAASEHVPSSIAALTPAPKPAKAPAGEAGEPAAEPAEGPAPKQSGERADDEAPSVVAQQRAILESFDGEDEEELADEPPAPRPDPVRAEIVPLPQRAAMPAGRKAAFTLRLDPERHLRLRLACAVTGRSAQQIVTGALDELLAGIPELDGLAAGAAGAKRN
jgi:hypothetical protein